MARLAILDGYQNSIELSVTPIYSQHEFIIIDDTDPNFVVVEDETGMVRTIPRKKNDSSAWIVAAIAAGLMLL